MNTRLLAIGAITRTLQVVLTVISGLWLLPFTLNHIGTVDYGLLVMQTSIVGFLINSDLGMGAAVGRLTPKYIASKDYDGVNHVICTSFVFFTILSLIGFILVSIMAYASEYFFDDQITASKFAWSLLVLSICVPIQFPIRSFGGLLLSYLRYDILAYIEIISLILKIALSIWFLINGYGIMGLCAAQLISVIVASIIEVIWAIKVYGHFKFKFEYIQKDTIRHLFSYGIVAFISDIAENSRFKTIPFIINYLIGTAAITTYAVASKLTDIAESLIFQLNKMLVPVFAHSTGEDQTRKIFNTSLMLTSTIVTYAGICIWFYGDAFIKLWVGDKVTNVHTILGMMTIIMYIKLINMPAKEYIYNIAKHANLARLHITEVISVAVLSFIFGMEYGLNGLVVGTAIGLVLPELAIPVLFCRESKLSLLSTYGKHAILPLINSLVVGFVVGYWLLSSGINIVNYKNLIIINILHSILFFIIIALTVVPFDDIKRFFVRSRV